MGWLRTIRTSKHITFLSLNDGSNLGGLQVIVRTDLPNDQEVRQLNTGAALAITGELVASAGKGQAVELVASEVVVLGASTPDYPLQKKRHGFEFLRTVGHLRVRTNTFGATFRVRSAMTQAIHAFFAERAFVHVHTPLITGSDTEGAGEMFRVTTLDLDQPLPRTPEGEVDWSKDFFGQGTFLTVSGQLNAEAFALGLSDVYTFGPCFRAENSHTSRHSAEFWMLEPEMAFCDLAGACDLAEELVRYLISVALEGCAEDMQFFDQHVAPGKLEELQRVLDQPFERMSYTEAIAHLERSGRSFEFPVHFGASLQAEHECYLTDELVGRPVFVTDYPREIKAFYMRRNDDGKTVAATDLLMPGLGEMIGGSQREERYDVLAAALGELAEAPEYSWFMDTRRFGTVPHAGFGMGFERLLMYITGMKNIRDVLPFPRTAGSCAF